jgi:hypothetical protein
MQNYLFGDYTMTEKELKCNNLRRRLMIYAEILDNDIERPYKIDIVHEMQRIAFQLQLVLEDKA